MTVTIGTNVIVGQDREKLKTELAQVSVAMPRKESIPPLWDGHAGERIAATLGSIPVETRCIFNRFAVSRVQRIHLSGAFMQMSGCQVRRNLIVI